MNAPEHRVETVSIQIGEALVTIPARAAALAYIEQRIDELRPVELGIEARDIRPPIGASYGGGRYAGVTLHNDEPFELVLLPGEAEEVNWKQALEWAEQQGGCLPSRFDQLVLFKNMKSEFQPRWYWAGEQPAGDADCAWSQDFDDGGQGCNDVSGRDRARAVRRIAIR